MAKQKEKKEVESKIVRPDFVDSVDLLKLDELWGGVKL